MHFHWLALCATLAIVVTAPADVPPDVAAARRFVASLDATAKAKALKPFDDPNRLDWHYVPRARAGLPLAAMDDGARRATHDLLRALLSDSGYHKVDAIMQLEDVLKDVERGAGPERDSGLYYLTLFGDPERDGPFGIRFEGHHVSLNVTRVGEHVALTPLFLGANPATVGTGLRAGFEALAEEMRAGAEFLATLSDEERAAARLDEVPSDVTMRPGIQVDPLHGRGVAVPPVLESKIKLHLLLDAIMRVFRIPMQTPIQLDAEGASREPTRFAFAGDFEPGHAHYYRLTTRSHVIEFDNVQNGANHVHFLIRSIDDDFGAALLARHRRDESGR